jgi:MHS family citrate/tricarballylate:H+ symporter-like MFS transporter
MLSPSRIARGGIVMQTRPVLSLAQLAAVAVGNALEFYDFLVFAFFATQIGHAFFPVHDKFDSLLLTLATFGVGFLTRPLGGLMIGGWGDRVGRKPAMMLSFGLMGLAIVGLALTPSYAVIGLAAPALAVLFRLLQGFALGGEVGPSTAFLLEAAPPEKRGLYVSLQFATQNGAVLIAGLIGLGLANLMSAAALSDWGWRIAFLTGAAVVPFGMILRRRLPETLSAAPQIPRPRLGTAEAKLALLALVLLGADTIATYTMNYMTTYAINTLGIAARIAFGATVVTGLAGVCCNPVGGYLSDRFGRRPVTLIALAAVLLVTLPCFMVMNLWRTPLALLCASALMAALVSLGVPAILVAISESLPPRLRSGGLGLLYALGISTFGGTTQFIVTWLIGLTGSPLAPAWYMSGAVALGVVAMALMRETAPVKLGAPL